MKTYRQLAMGLLALMICIALPSCSDEDDEEELSETALQGALDLFNLKLNLCSLDANGEPKEAIFGQPSNEANPAERVYYTKDIATAKKRFQSLFHSSTQCSSDGNTFTLADNQGKATFTIGDGNKGLLGTATFDVPGLKGKVTKIYFIDHTQRGNNGLPNFGVLDNVKFANVLSTDSWLGRYSIALFPFTRNEGEDEEDEEIWTYWLACTPYIESPKTYFIPADCNTHYGIQLLPLLEKLTEEEYTKLYHTIYNFLSNDDYTPDITNLLYGSTVRIYYKSWDQKSFYMLAKTTGEIDRVRKRLYATYHYVLITPDNYADRTKLYAYNQGEPLPSELTNALPIATKYHELSYYNTVEIVEE
ncbi:MAG: hypothetical protein SOW01_06440 [Mediterranea sp.]|nr:hypothetical protein [Mediterranea sp.]